MPASLVSILVSAVAAAREEPTALLHLPLVLAGGALVQAGANLWNDYADELNGTDRANAWPSPFNGGSRLIQTGELSVAAARNAALACYAAAMAIALGLAPSAGWGVPCLAAAGIVLSIAYSSPPIWFSGSGWGELVLAFCFGPLLAEGTALALTGRHSWPAFLASLPLGLFVAAILTINEIPDREADLAANKRTFVVRHGVRGAAGLYRFFILAAYGLLVLFVLGEMLPARAGLALLTIPAAIPLLRSAGRLDTRADAAFLRAAGRTARLHLGTGLLLCAGLLIAR